MRVLVLGGSTEASRLARRMAEQNVQATLSLAGRTANPVAQPLPVRIGGFGGVEGLRSYLKAERIDAVVDATHPFAARMSANALAACGEAGVPLARFTRPPWTARPGDLWTFVRDFDAAAHALGAAPKRVFLAVGRLHLGAFQGLQHHFVIRTIDPTDDAPRGAELILAKGPFTVEGDLALLQDRAIDVIVSKNSGGAATEAKLEAARLLRLPVVLIEPPAVVAERVFHDIEALLDWIGSHRTAP